MNRGLTIEQMEFLVAKGLSGEEILAFAKLSEVKPEVSAGALRLRRYRERRKIQDKEWAALTAQVTERDGWVCSYCDCDTSLPQNGYAIDHVLALNRGGTNDLDNLTMACRACNSSKQDKLLGDEWCPPNDDFARWQLAGCGE